MIYIIIGTHWKVLKNTQRFNTIFLKTDELHIGMVLEGDPTLLKEIAAHFTVRVSLFSWKLTC